MIRTRTVSGALVALLGLVIAMVEFLARWFFSLRHEHYDMSAWPILFGCVVIFLGGFIMDAKRAEDAGGFVVTSVTRIIEVVRTGKRSTDPTVTTITTTTAAPAPAPAKPEPGDAP